MSAPHADEARRRRYVLSQFRCALVWVRLAQVDIETAILALDRNLISAEEAVAMFWESPAVELLGLDFSDGIQAGRIGSCQHEVRA